jgi:hypothetical protein
MFLIFVKKKLCYLVSEFDVSVVFLLLCILIRQSSLLTTVGNGVEREKKSRQVDDFFSLSILSTVVLGRLPCLSPFPSSFILRTSNRVSNKKKKTTAKATECKIFLHGEALHKNLYFLFYFRNQSIHIFHFSHFLFSFIEIFGSCIFTDDETYQTYIQLFSVYIKTLSLIK